MFFPPVFHLTPSYSSDPVQPLLPLGNLPDIYYVSCSEHWSLSFTKDNVCVLEEKTQRQEERLITVSVKQPKEWQLFW